MGFTLLMAIGSYETINDGPHVHIAEFYQYKMILNIGHQMAMSGKNHSPLREEFVLQPQDGISPLFARTLDSLTLISFVSPDCMAFIL